ncbi:uncharacterized protein LOC143184519 [Calliopsis andreniformis]|uniref:uncharacterized protein LOC143184519 n=1 Tax=Calliopsis andreniformis TaxID=337506 RepID=UPI003FCDFAB2
MVCPSSVIAHLAKFLVTIGCMATVRDPFGKTSPWSFRVFQILLSHSILGILRFGAPFVVSTTNVAKYLRIFYDWYSKIIDILPLALFTAGFLNGYGINDKIWLIVLSLGLLPIFFQLQLRRKKSHIRRHQLLLNITFILQLLMITLVGLRNSNYNVISLVVSYIFERFFIDEFCYYYNIPSTDLTQYCLCFTEIFMVLTLIELSQ